MPHPYARVICSVLLSLLPRVALGESVSGRVYSAGPPAKRWTIVESGESGTPVKLCPNDEQLKATKFTNAVVAFEGDWSSHGETASKCFLASRSDVLEIAPGRPAIIGALSELSKNQFAITNATGRQWILSKLAPGLRDLRGRTVIADLVANDASTGRTTWLVARMYEHP
jgi:hypothetical protein